MSAGGKFLFIGQNLVPGLGLAVAVVNELRLGQFHAMAQNTRKKTPFASLRFVAACALC